MTTGNQQDQFNRMKSLLPNWFGDETPLLDALLLGFAYVKSFLYSLVVYVGLQTRIKTATNGFLDLIASDFFGGVISRSAGQTDDSFRNTITVNLFRERGTRHALISLMTELTGRVPVLFEPQRPIDTGGYGISTIGYGVAGGYGSVSIPYQCFVTVYRPTNGSVVTDAEIYTAVESIKPVGSIIWVRISD